PLSVALMRSFISSIPFADMDFSDALRHLMAHFRLPGEAQKIDRILEQFAGTYHTLNPGTFKEESTPYILAFSLIMLNTDAHNPAVKKKMSLADFIRNNRGIDGGADLPQKLLRKLYWEVVSREIVM
ncbi:Sec7 domain-containing protein, partial [Blastocladiella britannica]